MQLNKGGIKELGVYVQSPAQGLVCSQHSINISVNGPCPRVYGQGEPEKHRDAERTDGGKVPVIKTKSLGWDEVY